MVIPPKINYNTKSCKNPVAILEKIIKI